MESSEEEVGRVCGLPQGVLELWERVQEEWGKIKPEVCQGLINSMPSQVEAIIKAKGGYI